jgi:hypothetical protein
MASVLFQTSEEELSCLSSAADSFFANPVARRLFIHYHEKITTQLYMEILGGQLPAIIEECIINTEQTNNALKLLICLKRSAALLGLESFYNYKLTRLSDRLLATISKSDASHQLVDLWKEISKTYISDDAELES